MKLLPSQKNQLFNLIVQQGFSPSQFSYKEIEDNRDNRKTMVKIEYKGMPDFHFLLADDFSHGDFLVAFSPSNDKYIESIVRDNWGFVFSDFSRWLLCLLAEIEQEDLWESMDRLTLEIQIDNGFDNEKFTVQQYQILSDRIKLLQTGVSGLALESEQIDAINGKLDRLLEQGKTMSKSDWQASFIGNLWTLIVAMSISPEMGHQIWLLVKQFFNGILLLP